MEAECLWKYPLQVALPLLQTHTSKVTPLRHQTTNWCWDKLSNYSSYCWPSLLWIAAQYVEIFPLISYAHTPMWDDIQWCICDCHPDDPLQMLWLVFAFTGQLGHWDVAWEYVQKLSRKCWLWSFFQWGKANLFVSDVVAKCCFVEFGLIWKFVFFIELITYLHKRDHTFRVFWCCFLECLWISGIDIFLVLEHEWAVIWCLHWCLFWGSIGWGWWCWCFFGWFRWQWWSCGGGKEQLYTTINDSFNNLVCLFRLRIQCPTLVNCLQHAALGVAFLHFQFPGDGVRLDIAVLVWTAMLARTAIAPSLAHNIMLSCSAFTLQ